MGDVAGFTASVTTAGWPWCRRPTTLLAQVDAAIGGKTGVNLPEGKNLVGAFHQPSAVLADAETLATLPEREYRAGLGEVAKYTLDAPTWHGSPRSSRRASAVVPAATPTSSPSWSPRSAAIKAHPGGVRPAGAHRPTGRR